MKVIERGRSIVRGAPEITEIDHFRTLTEALFAQLALTARTIIEKFGDSGRGAIKEAWEEFADIHARSLQVEGLLRRMNIEEFAKFMVQFEERVGSKTELKKVDDKTISIRVSECFRAKIFKIVGAPREMCDWLSAADQGLAKAANPKMTMELVSNIHRGDPYCEFVVKIKE